METHKSKIFQNIFNFSMLFLSVNYFQFRICLQCFTINSGLRINVAKILWNRRHIICHIIWDFIFIESWKHIGLCTWGQCLKLNSIKLSLYDKTPSFYVFWLFLQNYSRIDRLFFDKYSLDVDSVLFGDIYKIYYYF